MYSTAYRLARGHSTDTRAAKIQDRPSTWKAMVSFSPMDRSTRGSSPRRVNTAARAHTAVRQADPTTKFCRAVRSLGRQAARAPPASMGRAMANSIHMC